MAELTVQEVLLTGLAPAYVAAAVGGDYFVNDGKTFLEARNASAGAITVTITSQEACDQGFTHNPAVVVPITTGQRMIGPFSRKRFNDANGRVQIAYSDVTTFTVAAIKVDDGV